MTSTTSTTPEATTPEAPEAQGEKTPEERSKALKEAYTAATARLREEKRDEFEAFYVEEAKKRGVTYTPRPTADQKAAQQLADLLTEHPDLVDRLQRNDDGTVTVVG